MVHICQNGEPLMDMAVSPPPEYPPPIPIEQKELPDMKYFNTYYLKGFIPIVTAGIGGYISYQASNKDTITKLEMAKLSNQAELLKIESNERIKLQELIIKHKELDLKLKELDLKYPNLNTIAKYDQEAAPPPISEGSNSALGPAMDLGKLTSDSNIGELATNGGTPTIEKMIISPFENWALLLSPITDYIENLSREQLLGLSFLLYIGVVIWCFSWILVYSYLSRKTIDWGEKYGDNQLVVLIMNIIRYSSVGLGYIYICTIYLCLGLSGGLAYYIFING